MFTVIFEVHPGDGKKDDYLAHAKELKPVLEAIDGFIDNERFESKRREGWVLSLSTWRDEKSVVRWRTVGRHHHTQQVGREEIFSDYHLRVCQVTDDSAPPEGIPVIEQRFDTTEKGEARALAVTEVAPAEGAASGPDAATLTAHLGLDERDQALVELDVFESIITPGKLLLLTSWRTAEAAAGWAPHQLEGAASVRHRRMRNIRDYGMFDRAEAPQYYPEAVRRG